MTSPDCVRASNSQTHFFFSSDSAGWHLTGLMWHLRSFFPTFFYKQLTMSYDVIPRTGPRLGAGTAWRRC